METGAPPSGEEGRALQMGIQKEDEFKRDSLSLQGAPMRKRFHPTIRTGLPRYIQPHRQLHKLAPAVSTGSLVWTRHLANRC